MDDHELSLLILIVLACLLPPLAVFLKKRDFGMHFWLNLGLTFFVFWIPGVVHALWVVLSNQHPS